jgi:hypothetical protein
VFYVTHPHDLTVRLSEDLLAAETAGVSKTPDEIRPPFFILHGFQVQVRLRTPDGTDGPLTKDRLETTLVYTRLVFY